MITDFNRVFPIGHPEAKGPDSHIVPAAVAAFMKNPNQPNGPEWNHVDFLGEAIFDLLKQDGARGLRIFPAFNGHHVTVAMLALDAEGNEIVSGNAIGIENGERCPPVC